MKYHEFKNHKEISQGRKLLYYCGTGLIVVGLLLFLSMFISAASIFSRPANLGEGPGFMRWGVAGFVLILIGNVLRGIGARGLAGSGVVLDPERAREDLAPYTGALGGMARDAMDAFKSDSGEKEEAPQVMVRCRSCKELNKEDAKFCDQCGTVL